MLEIQSLPQPQHDQWLHERHRYEVLSRVYRMTNADPAVTLGCGDLASELGFTREEVFRILHDLEFRGYLAYVGSGPRVRITPRAVAYLLVDSGRRRSIRDTAELAAAAD